MWTLKRTLRIVTNTTMFLAFVCLMTSVLFRINVMRNNDTTLRLVSSFLWLVGVGIAFVSFKLMDYRDNAVVIYRDPTNNI